MEALKDFIIKLPQAAETDFPIVAAKIELPAGSTISWATTLRFDDGLRAFITVDRKFIEIMNGRTVEESYTAYTGKALGFMEKHRTTEFNVYAYRSSITGCSVGTGFSFVDLADGNSKTLGTFWNCTLSVTDPEKLINMTANAENGVIATDRCSGILRNEGNLHGILEQVLGRILQTTPFTAIHTRTADIGEAVASEFNSKGGCAATGFKIECLFLGNIELTDNE